MLHIKWAEENFIIIMPHIPSSPYGKQRKWRSSATGGNQEPSSSLNPGLPTLEPVLSLLDTQQIWISLLGIDSKMYLSFITKHRGQGFFVCMLLVITCRDFLCYIAMWSWARIQNYSVQKKEVLCVKHVSILCGKTFLNNLYTDSNNGH